METKTKNSILIIGGGLIGLSIAYEFARNKFKVEVLSKNRSESAGFVAAGMLATHAEGCLLYTSPSPRDLSTSRMPSSA